MSSSELRSRILRRLALTAAAVVLCCPAAHALTIDEILNYRGADRQTVLEEGARKEGTLIVYSGMIVNQLLRPLTEAFERKYPFIKTRYWRGDANQLVVKVLAEIQANALVADVVEGSGISGSVGGAKFVLPFHSPLLAALSKDGVAHDRTWAATRLRYIGLGYNTKFIAREEAPRNYDDLLDPKWRRKMAWNASSDASGALVTITTLLASWGEAKTDAYIARLARQDMTPLTVSNRQVVDQVILGEYWIGVGISAHHPVISAGKGAPAATVLFDPVPSLIDCIQVVKGAKHPHAAMLFVDFILSTEAQRMMQAAEYFPSRPDIGPAPSLRVVEPKSAGVPALTLNFEQLEELTPKSIEIYKKHFR